jgi:hypothetical protein
MPSKAFKLAESIVSNPVMNDIVTNTTAVPATITAQIATSTDQGVSTVADLPDTGNNPGDIQLVEATNRLYVWNGSGWYNIALINQTPTWDSGGQPSGSYVLDNDSPQDATVITLAASDPDGLPISYSYVTSGSMDSMATIGQDSSVFTITPKTVAQVGEGVELTGSITFRASDGVNILPSVSSFTLSFVTLIENSNHTTLLATAVDTSDNNNITDSSTNNHTITVAGDAHAGTFSPYRHGGYSTYFDGTGDRLSIAHSTELQLGTTSAFTAEFWVYIPTTNADYSVLLGKGLNTGTAEWYLELMADGAIDLFLSNNGTNYNYLKNTVTGVLQHNTWYHIALVRENTSTIKVYTNGVQSYSNTSVSDWNIDTGIVQVGGYFDGSTNLASNTYLTDVRIVKGTAVYTSNFTPPTERLTAITNTTLLIGHLPYIADGSSNAHSITVNGNTSTKPFTPYDNLEYAATDHGASIFLDGTGDYLTINDTNIANFGTNDFTIEAWVYCNDTAANQIVETRPFSTNGAYVTIAVGNTIGVLISTNSAEIFPGGVGTINVGQWHHVAWVRNSGTISVYVDGTSVGSASNSTNFISSNVGIGWNAYIGENTGSVYISDLRIVKGTAVYTGNFTPPTTTLTAITNTSLLISGTDASIIDKSQGNNLKLVGNTTGSTTQVKFAGSKSMYFDGNGDKINLDANNSLYNLSYGQGDFTIEGWFYFNSYSSNPKLYIDIGSASTYWQLYYVNGTGLTFRANNTGINVNAGSTLSLNTWYYIALVRNSSTYNVYVDGTSVISTTTTHQIGNYSEKAIGGTALDATASLDGYIQDFRITKGLARYTSNFTPPTESLKG